MDASSDNNIVLSDLIVSSNLLANPTNGSANAAEPDTTPGFLRQYLRCIRL